MAAFVSVAEAETICDAIKNELTDLVNKKIAITAEIRQASQSRRIPENLFKRLTDVLAEIHDKQNRLLYLETEIEKLQANTTIQDRLNMRTAATKLHMLEAKQSSLESIVRTCHNCPDALRQDLINTTVEINAIKKELRQAKQKSFLV